MSCNNHLLLLQLWKACESKQSLGEPLVDLFTTQKLMYKKHSRRWKGEWVPLDVPKIMLTKIVYQCLTIIVRCLTNVVNLCLTNVVNLCLTTIVKLVKFVKHNFTRRPSGIWVLLMWVVPIQDKVSLNYNPLFQGKTFWFQPCRLCTWVYLFLCLKGYKFLFICGCT